MSRRSTIFKGSACNLQILWKRNNEITAKNSSISLYTDTVPIKFLRYSDFAQNFSKSLSVESLENTIKNVIPIDIVSGFRAEFVKIFWSPLVIQRVVL